MNPEPVSIIIPTYNRASFLKKAIDSVLSQTYDTLELIVVDDGSDDGTEDLVAAYGSEVVSLRQENRGPSAARNAGIRAARSDLIAFLDSDDWFDKRKLAIQVAAMQNNPSFLISHTEEIWYRCGAFLNQKKKHRKSGGDIFARCLELCAVGMSTVMVRRTLFDTVGLFDETLPCCEDYDLWLRASVKHPFLFVDTPLTSKQGGRPDQLSAIYRVGMDRFRIRAIRNILASGMLCREQTQLAEAELVKKCTLYGKGCLRHNRPDEGEKYLLIAEQVLNPEDKIREVYE